MDFFEAFVCDVGVDLGGSDGRVTEHSLDTSDISTIHEEVGSKTVTKGVRMDVFEYTCLGGVVFDDTSDTASGETERFTFAVFSIHQTLFGIGDEEGWVDVRTDIEVGFEGFFGWRRNKHNSEFAPLSSNTELFFFEIDMVAVEADEF